MKLEIKIIIEDNETDNEKFIDKLTKRIREYLNEQQQNNY
tara:strand:+ start:2323 stop:2442 length:120 start_codon:yes stop_codon:yes gene_type:complete